MAGCGAKPPATAHAVETSLEEDAASPDVTTSSAPGPNTVIRRAAEGPTGE